MSSHEDPKRKAVVDFAEVGLPHVLHRQGLPLETKVESRNVAFGVGVIIPPTHTYMQRALLVRHINESAGLIVVKKQILLLAKPKRSALRPIRHVVADGVLADNDGRKTFATQPRC